MCLGPTPIRQGEPPSLPIINILHTTYKRLVRQSPFQGSTLENFQITAWNLNMMRLPFLTVSCSEPKSWHKWQWADCMKPDSTIPRAQSDHMLLFQTALQTRTKRATQWPSEPLLPGGILWGGPSRSLLLLFDHGISWDPQQTCEVCDNTRNQQGNYRNKSGSQLRKKGVIYGWPLHVFRRDAL